MGESMEAAGASGFSRRVLTFVWIVFALLAISFFAHFFSFQEFGFYEDDWFIVVPAFSGPPASMHAIMWSLENPQPFSGRPLGFMLTRFLVSDMGETGAFSNLYLLGCVLLAFNAMLLYCLLRRVVNREVAFFGAVLFLLFPADTTRQFLVHILFIQTSLALALLHVLVFQTRARWAAILLLPFPLLVYESAYFLCVVAPLLRRSSNRIRWLTETMAYFVVWITLLVGYAVYRSPQSDLRLQQASSTFADIGQSLWGLVKTLILADVAAATTFVYWPVQMLSLAAAPYWLPALGLVLFAALATSILRRVGGATDIPVGDQKLSVWDNRLVRAGLALFLVGGASAALISLTQNPTDTSVLAGRVTRFYLMSGIGVVLVIVACRDVLGRRPLPGQTARYGMTFAGWAMIWFYAAYAMKVQEDYRAGWRVTSDLIHQVVDLSADMAKGDKIVVEADEWFFVSPFDGGDASMGAYIGLPYALENIFAFPDMEKAEMPRLFLTARGWTGQLTRSGEEPCLAWKKRVLMNDWRGDNAVCEQSVILLKSEEGRLVREDQPYLVEGMDIVKPPSTDIKSVADNPDAQPGVLYDFVFAN